MPPIRTLQDVVDWGLCTGCGACRYTLGDGHVALVNIESVGIRPCFSPRTDGIDEDGLAVCPGIAVDGTSTSSERVAGQEADSEIGGALEIWKGYATDPEIRFRASSGGVLSALAVYCLEREKMGLVLHSGMDDQRPWLNKTVQSRTREEVLRRAGSRYAPSSPCEGLEVIEDSDRPCVFIGKPCDTSAVARLRSQVPQLDRRLGLVLSFFCAGTPSTRGTLHLIEEMNTPREKVTGLRYRGEGWPGRFKVETRDGKPASLSYEESWGKLSTYRPLRCHLCPDGFGQIADITCGDAWDDFGEDGDPGRSIVIVRTRRGQEMLSRAAAAGYVQLVRSSAESVLLAQPNLLTKRREILSRLVGLWLVRAPFPVYTGFSLRRAWMRLPVARKARTIVGSIKRVLSRRLWRRRPISPLLDARTGTRRGVSQRQSSGAGREHLECRDSE